MDMSLGQLLFSFKGRCTRRQVWGVWTCVAIIASVMKWTLDIGSWGFWGANAFVLSQVLQNTLGVAVMVVSYIIFFALIVKRYHDLGKSAHTHMAIIVVLLMIIGLCYLINALISVPNIMSINWFQDIGQQFYLFSYHANFSKPLAIPFTFIPVLLFKCYFFWLSIVAGFCRGQHKDNAYGSSPY